MLDILAKSFFRATHQDTRRPADRWDAPQHWRTPEPGVRHRSKAQRHD